MSNLTEVQRTNRKISEARFHEATFNRNVWSIIPEFGTTKEDILRPEYWAHISIKLKPMDKIEVVFEDMSQYIELMVVDSGRVWTKVVVISEKMLENVEQELPKELKQFEVKWQGPHNKYVVVRLKDNEILKKEISSKEEATLWLQNYRKTLAA